MTGILQKYGPSVSAWAGLLLMLLAFLDRSESFVLAGSVLFGLATVAAQGTPLSTSPQGESRRK